MTPPPTTPRSLTVVVPMYQEAGGVAALCAAMQTLREAESARIDRSVDVVVVDDGSTDETAERLRSECDGRPWLRVTTHPANRGLTAALTTGLEAATGDTVAWFDSDLTYDPGVLAELAATVDGGADVAIASCYHPAGGIAGVPAWRLALSKGASTSYRWCTRTGLHTYTSMVRAYRREVLDACRPSRGGFLGVTEVLLRALRQGRRCVEVPAVLARRRVGQSKMRIARVAFGHLGLLAAWLFGRLGPRRIRDRAVGEET